MTPPVAPKAAKAAPKGPKPTTTPAPKAEVVARQWGWLAGLIKRFFSEGETTGRDVVENEAAAHARCRALQRRIIIQGYLILVLLIAVIVLIPVLKPIYRYQTIADDKARRELIPLSMPNLNDGAILSWAATSITEILTFGFGDFDQRMLSHRDLFTDQGWESFTTAIRDQNMRETFRLRQLVLTSVPANQPVIVGKGLDKENMFQWFVEMPVIMTYTTNNNVTSRQRGIVQLVVVRVPSSQNVAGIGIKSWVIQ